MDRILRYIVKDLCNPSAASALMDEVERCHDFLRTNPGMYEACKDYKLSLQGFRKVAIKNYLLIYRIHEEQKTVNIVRYIYSARDYTKLL